MEQLKSGSLKIWLTHHDMEHWGLVFDRMAADDIATRHVILRLLRVAEERLLLPTDTDVTVEALPIDGGCLLLLTPHSAFSRVRLHEPTVYSFFTADDLLHFGRCLQALSPRLLPTSSLFGWQREYRLIVYPDIPLQSDCRRQLLEFATPAAKGYVAAAYTEEHGVRLVIGDALQRLCC